MTNELEWNHAIEDIADSGLSVERTAEPGELERLARALEVDACSRLTARYAITPIGGGRYKLAGSLEAQVCQTCVATLEPVVSDIEEKLDAVFWPAPDIPAPQSGEVDLRDEPEPEPIVAGQIAAGRLVYECLAAVIDPFPRQPGATFEWAAQAGEGKPESPFAVLANLKSKS
jgi:uncharacterized metal-binding protein YceD (DUF177 family)